MLTYKARLKAIAMKILNVIVGLPATLIVSSVLLIHPVWLGFMTVTAIAAIPVLILGIGALHSAIDSYFDSRNL